MTTGLQRRQKGAIFKLYLEEAFVDYISECMVTTKMELAEIYRRNIHNRRSDDYGHKYSVIINRVVWVE